MDIQAFMDRHNLKPENIDGAACLEQLLKKMEQGLAGEGNIPMIPSYLSLNTHTVAGQPCCVWMPAVLWQYMMRLNNKYLFFYNSHFRFHGFTSFRPE